MQITEHVRDGVLVLTVAGRLNFYSRKTFQAVMRHAEKSTTNHVVLNLQGVISMDSVALGMLVLSQTRLSIKGIEMSLVEPPSGVREILDVANIPKLIPVYSTEQAAIGTPAVV